LGVTALRDAVILSLHAPSELCLLVDTRPAATVVNGFEVQVMWKPRALILKAQAKYAALFGCRALACRSLTPVPLKERATRMLRMRQRAPILSARKRKDSARQPLATRMRAWDVTVVGILGQSRADKAAKKARVDIARASLLSESCESMRSGHCRLRKVLQEKIKRARSEAAALHRRQEAGSGLARPARAFDARRHYRGPMLKTGRTARGKRKHGLAGAEAARSVSEVVAVKALRADFAMDLRLETDWRSPSKKPYSVASLREAQVVAVPDTISWSAALCTVPALVCRLYGKALASEAFVRTGGKEGLAIKFDRLQQAPLTFCTLPVQEKHPALVKVLARASQTVFPGMLAPSVQGAKIVVAAHHEQAKLRDQLRGKKVQIMDMDTFIGQVGASHGST
jgi:hypothetical protein